MDPHLLRLSIFSPVTDNKNPFFYLLLRWITYIGAIAEPHMKLVPECTEMGL